MLGEWAKLCLIAVAPMKDCIILRPIDEVGETSIHDRGKSDLASDGVKQCRTDAMEFIDHGSELIAKLTNLIFEPEAAPWTVLTRDGQTPAFKLSRVQADLVPSDVGHDSPNERKSFMGQGNIEYGLKGPDGSRDPSRTAR